MSINDATVMPVLAVDDIERATGFYKDKLGCDIQRFQMDSNAAVIEFGRGQRIFLYKSTMRRGETTAAALVVDDVKSTVDELRRRGVVFEDYDMPGLKTVNGIVSEGDFKAAWFKDTEGNVISVGVDLLELERRAA